MSTEGLPENFVDTHIHLWNLGHPTLYWEHLQNPDFVHPVMGPQLKKLAESDFEIEDYLADTQNRVSKAIHVQAAIGSDDPVEETKWLQEAADRTGFPHGIVAYADLRDPKVERVIERHCEYANMRGIRDFSYGDYLVASDFHRGFARLADHNLVASLDVKWEEMPKLRSLAEKFPEISIVLDHAGFPTERSPEYFANWREGIAVLAGAPNITCKISGFGMAENDWSAESIEPWVHHCIEAFSPERIVFASNWPVDKLWTTFERLMAAYSKIIRHYSGDERRAMFSENAESIYRI